MEDLEWGTQGRQNVLKERMSICERREQAGEREAAGRGKKDTWAENVIETKQVHLKSCQAVMC